MFGSGTQRKVFTTPVPDEADDVSVVHTIPKIRGLNKERGCAAVSIGEKYHRSVSRSWPNDSPNESGPCVKTMLGVRFAPPKRDPAVDGCKCQRNRDTPQHDRTECVDVKEVC